MCIEILSSDNKNLEPNVADSDITCYKIMRCINRGDILITPFRHWIANINKPLVADYLGSAEWNDVFNIWRVEHGIHTLQTLVDVDHYISLYNHLFTIDDTIIYECIIPKGTKYYIGCGGDYCSERIEFVKMYVPIDTEKNQE